MKLSGLQPAHAGPGFFARVTFLALNAAPDFMSGTAVFLELKQEVGPVPTVVHFHT